MKKIIVFGVLASLVFGGVSFQEAKAQVAPLQVGGSVVIYGAWPSSVNVRVSPCTSSFGCDVIGKAQDGAIGVITDGPRSGSGYTWWKVRFSSFGVFGLEGWVVNSFLRSTTPASGSGSGGQDTITPTPTGSFTSPVGGEVWTQGQTKLISWQTPASWDVSEISLILADVNGNNLRSIAILKDGVSADIQGGGDFGWTIPTSVFNGSYKVKATVNLQGVTSPNIILSNQFTVGVQSGGGDGGGGTGGGDTTVGEVKTTTIFTGCSTNAPATPMPTGNRAPTVSYFINPTSDTVGTWGAGGSDPDGNVFFYQINWGDGNYNCWSSSGYPSGVYGISHTFAPGTYQVKLRVIDVYGAYNESVKSFTVSGSVPPPVLPPSPPQPLAPVINSFGITDQAIGRPGVPFELIFNASDADGGLRSYSVNWGDGSVVESISISGNSIVKNVSHTYSAAGRYFVDLTVTDSTNLTATRRTTITVAAPAACSTRFVIGDRVKVINGSPERGVNVRSTPSTGNTPLGTQANNNQGSVVGGPTLGNGLCWWNVNYDTAPDGWTAEFDGVVNLLERVVSTPIIPPPVLPPPPPVTDPGTQGDTGGQTGGFSGTVTGSNLVVGDSIRTAYYVKVRETPSLIGVLKGTQSVSKFGKIIAGPVSASGLTWWNIDYVNAPDGWSAERDESGVILLIKDSPPPVIIPGQPTNGAPVLGQITQVTAPGVNTQGTWQVSATDPNGGNLNYTVDWGDGTSTNYSGDSGQTISINHTYTQAGARNITVAVSDGQNTVSGTPFAVTIGGTTGPNQAPVLDALTAPTQATVNVSTAWQIRATDANGGNLNYTVNWGDGATNNYSGASGQSVSAPHTYSATGSKTITVTVSDGSLTDSKTLTVNVVTGGGSTRGPSSQISGPQTAVSGVATSWQFIAYDPDSPSISFVINWGDGTSSNFSGPPGVAKMMDHTYTQTGPRSITVVATDNTGMTHGSSWGINVTTPDLATAKPNVPVVTGPNQVTIGVNSTWTVTLNDPDTNSLTYTVNWNDGSAIENGTATRGVPFTISHTYATLFTGYKSIVINVSDGTNTEWTTRQITSKLPNQAPTIGSVSGPVDVKTATTRTWYITGTDPEGAAVNYTFNWGDGTSNNYTGKASGVSFGASHIYNQSGTFTITVMVTDNGGLSAASNAYTVRVNKFAVNDRVEVLSTLTTTLAVRATPSPTGVWIGGVYPLNKNGSKGTILEGPIVAGGYTWWRVAWDATMTGWSAEDWLVKTN